MLEIFEIFFYQLIFSKKMFKEIASECQTVWIWIRSDVLLDLIWVQTAYNDYQQKRVKGLQFFIDCIFDSILSGDIFPNGSTIHCLSKYPITALWTRKG